MLGIKIGALERVKNKFEKLSFWTFFFFLSNCKRFCQKTANMLKFHSELEKKVFARFKN